MGYRNDQFYRLPLGEGTGSEGTQEYGTNLIKADNPDFSYPERVVRTIDKDGRPVTTGLERGYIRSMISSISGAVLPIKKCGFQFNPSSIHQVVSQPSSMLNFIQQDPGQYMQPMAGSVNFGFDLFFDRSMELNNPIAKAFNQAQLDNPWELLPPSEVGVLRDLAALYAVIGQGLSESQKDYVLQSLTQTLLREQNADTSVKSEDVQAKISSLSGTGGGTGFLAANVGNSAFLMPMPVRVVFSSLYIVEGLVQTSAVDFTKFNTAMVPMQCMVNLSLEAKYIGFAKKKTFFTVVLDEAKKQAIQQSKEEQDTIASVFGAMNNAAQSLDIEIGLASGGVQDGQLGGSDTLGKFPDNAFLVSLTNDAHSPTVYFTYARMSNSAAVIGSSAISDNVKKLFDEGTAMTISDTATVDVYGPIPALETGGPAAGINDPLSSGWQTYLRSKATSDLRFLSGNLSATPVSTGDDWVKLSKGSRSLGPLTVIYPPGQTIGPPQAIDPAASYIIRYRGSVNVTIQTTQEPVTYTGEGEFLELTTDSFHYPMIRRVTINWAKFTVADDALGTVQVDAPGSSLSPKPGDTSSVGNNKKPDKNTNRNIS